MAGPSALQRPLIRKQACFMCYACIIIGHESLWMRERPARAQKAEHTVGRSLAVAVFAVLLRRMGASMIADADGSNNRAYSPSQARREGHRRMHLPLPRWGRKRTVGGVEHRVCIAYRQANSSHAQQSSGGEYPISACESGQTNGIQTPHGLFTDTMTVYRKKRFREWHQLHSLGAKCGNVNKQGPHTVEAILA